MGQRSGRGRLLGWLLIVSTIMLLTAPVVPAAAAPPTAPAVPGSAPPSGDPRAPGNHAAEMQYFASLRQAPQGTSPSQARLKAINEAAKLPTITTLPTAVHAAGAASGPERNTIYPPTGNWQPLGPAAEDTDQANPTNDYQFGITSGRATAVVVGSHTGVIYLGTADGGVWKSTNNGGSWTALTDAQPSLAIGALALDPADVTDNTLYVGTGETSYDILPAPVFNGDAYFGVGVLKTTNGGTSWTLQGQSVFGGGTYSANSIGFDVLVVSGGTIRAGTTKGMFQSTDGGATWTQVIVSVGNNTARVTDLAVDGTNVYAVLSEANPGPAYTGVYKSLLSGASTTFAPFITGLPATSGWGRTRLAMAPSTPLTLYLSISDSTSNLLNNKIYKTTDGGLTWNAVTGTVPNYFNGGGGGQGNYDNVLLVDPTMPPMCMPRVCTWWHQPMAARTGRISPTCTVFWRPGRISPCHGPIHPDQHGLFMTAGGTLYIANDGGIWKTTNPNAGTSTAWTNLNANLNTTQFYAGDSAANYSVTPIVAAARKIMAPRAPRPHRWEYGATSLVGTAAMSRLISQTRIPSTPSTKADSFRRRRTLTRGHPFRGRNSPCSTPLMDRATVRSSLRRSSSIRATIITSPSGAEERLRVNQ